MSIMKTKLFKLFWVVLLVISAFTLGYSLKPKTSNRTIPPFMMPRGMQGQLPGMPPGRMAPPLNFRR